MSSRVLDKVVVKIEILYDERTRWLANLSDIKQDMEYMISFMLSDITSGAVPDVKVTVDVRDE